MNRQTWTLIICICTACYFIFTGIPTIPQLSAIEKDTTISSDGYETGAEDEMVHLQWNNMGEGITYECQISKDKGFQRILLYKKCEKPEITFPRPDASGTYYIRLRPISPDGQRWDFLPTQTYEINSTLGPPLITAPEEIAEIRDIFDLDVKWSNVPSAAGYHLILARDRLFKNVIFQNAKITGTFIRIRNLDYSTYFLKISSISKDGTEGLFPISGLLLLFRIQEVTIPSVSDEQTRCISGTDYFAQRNPVFINLSSGSNQ